LIDQSFEVFKSFSTKQHIGSFYGTPVQQIAYKCCINFAKTEFPYRI